jgi:hypothetical protein
VPAATPPRVFIQTTSPDVLQLAAAARPPEALAGVSARPQATALVASHQMRDLDDPVIV